MILLDTNVVSELRKAGDGKADRAVMRWMRRQSNAGLFISVITVLEIEFGILRIARRDVEQGARLREWLHTRVLPEFAERTLSIDRDIALACAALHVPNPRPERDAWLAATAQTHGMTLATRNVADFVGMKVSLVNPWET